MNMIQGECKLKRDMPDNQPAGGRLYSIQHFCDRFSISVTDPEILARIR